ncbi:MAG: SAM-dependent methyltransferase [Methanobrevibacter sp.]|jgi:tRNA U34 5-methylaminomethyl-2-thiouridine-forming methyltransferase MnmC|nr:SAM-dependent methyltransferase [Candidatus Methanoflexus mossambicus]
MNDIQFNHPYDLLNYYFNKENETLDLKYRQKLSEEILPFLTKTEDGSYTFKSPDFNDEISENMHTIAGAISESFEKFVNPLKLDWNISEEIAILDLCSGFGYNSAAFLNHFIEIQDEFNLSNSLRIDMIEKSSEICKIALVMPTIDFDSFKPINHNLIKRAIETKLFNSKLISIKLYENYKFNDKIKINLFIEDMREKVKSLPSNIYDGIFLDAFSPKLAPELYTIDFFKELQRVIKNTGQIVTYTSSIPVKSALIEAGFYIGKGSVFGRKTPGTIASLSKDRINLDLDSDEERLIALSDLGIPFRDENLTLNSQEVINQRNSKRKKLRNKTLISSAVKTPIYLGIDLNQENITKNNHIIEDKLKRRILRNLNEFGLDSTISSDAMKIIASQNMDDKENYKNNSRDRILAMKKALNNFFKENKMS